MNNIVFTGSKEGMNRKPQGRDVAKWQNVRMYSQETLSVEEIATKVSKGCCWRAGIYDASSASFKKANAKGSQVIALDFDGSEEAPDKVLEYAESLGIPANIVYATFSQDADAWNEWIEAQKKAEKRAVAIADYKYIYSRKGETHENEAKKEGYNYRIIWCLSSVVSVKEYEDMQKALMHLFRAFNPDKSTKDVSRLWFGSRLTAVVLSEEPIDTSTLKAVCGQVAVSRKMQEGKVMRNAVKGKKELIPDYAGLPEPQVAIVGDDWHQRLRYVCPLWDKFEDGEYLNYNERLTLFSNLKYLRRSDTSKSIYQDIMRFYKPEVWEKHTFDAEQLRTMLSTASLKALPIVRTGGKHMTVAEYMNSDETVIIPKDKESYVSLEELDAYLDEKIPALLESEGIQYFSSQTGSGKTKRIIDFLGKYLADFNKKVIYACPHFAGAHEFYQRFTETGFGYKIKVLPEQQLTAKDKMLLQLGLPKQTKCSERAEFIDEMINSNNGLYIITHALLVNMPTIKADIIIVDENIESSLIRTSILTYQQLYSLFPFLDYDTKKSFMHWLEDASQEQRGTKIKLDFMREKVAPRLRSRIEEYLSACETSPSLIPSGFFNCEDYDGVASVQGKEPVIRITHRSPLIQDALNQGIPVKLFSATPISAKISNYYGIEIEVIEAPKARNSGKIIQYTALSGAKGVKQEDDTFSKLPKLAQYVRESLSEDVIRDSKVISFKGTSDFWKSQGFNVAEVEGEQTHFKNNCGLDCFKGKSLIVIGKYDVNPEYYLGVWDDIGDGSEQPRQQNCSVELNGVKQNLYLWDKPQLRAEQLQNLREASEQTAGRARVLRESGATVHLFSNFVIAGVDKVVRK